MLDEDKENLKKWVQFFADFSYKPNFTFKVETAMGNPFGLPKVLITMHVPDSRAPKPEEERSPMGTKKAVPLIPVEKRVVLDRYHSDQYAREYLLWHIKEMEFHEVYEWFRHKGELVFDPHKEK